MKKILILAYDFPPYVSVGAIRPYHWYLNFKNLGLYPVVVTRQWRSEHKDERDYALPGYSSKIEIENTTYGTLIRTPYQPTLSNRLLLKYGKNRFRLIRKSITFFYEIAQWFIPVGTRHELYKGARAYLKKEKVDLIIASGEPFILFRYADMLSREFNIPWVADYRDPWSHAYETGHHNYLLDFHRKNEKKYSSRAAFIVTAFDFFALKIKSLLNHQTVYVVRNGYDETGMEKALKVKPDNRALRIGHIGSVNEWHPWRSVFRELNNFIAENNANIALHLYGVNIQQEMEKALEESFTELKKHTFFHPKTSTGALLPLLAENHLMLLFNHYGFIGTKIFDYIGIKRNILLCYTHDPEAEGLKEKYYRFKPEPGSSMQVQAGLIEQTGSGFPIKDASELRKILGQLYGEFVETGNISYKGHDNESFSRLSQTQKLAQLLLDVVEKKPKKLRS